VPELLRYTAVTGALALAAGFYLVSVRGAPVLVLLAIGAFFVLFYTWPLKYLGLGEPAVLVVWGPLMVGGSYYVVTGRLEPGVLIASLPFSFGATAVLMGKHIDKLGADAGKKIRTLPVLLGERLARAVTLALLVGQYLLVVVLVVSGYLLPVALMVALALPTLRLAARALRHPRPESPPKELPQGVWPLWFVAFAFLHTRRFGALYVLGILGDVIWRAFA
jgi:1,4-dihydroxy-2-naphthoate polyprenyltransferase